MDSVNLLDASIHYSALYLVVVCLSGFLGAFGKMHPVKKKRCIFLIMFLFWILMAFRGIDMGKDTSEYAGMYNRISLSASPFFYMRNSDVESGYILYNWLLSRFFSDPRVVFLLSSTIIAASIGRFAYKYVDNIGIFFCLFVGFLQLDFYMSAVRQSLSISIFLFAVDYLLERKRVPYFLLCVIAVLFHNSAIIYFLIYPLFSEKILMREVGLISNFLLFSGSFISGFFFDDILRLLFRLFPKYEYYIGSELISGDPKLAVFLKFAVYFLLLFVPKFMRKRPDSNILKTKLSEQMAILNVCFIIISSNATALMRFSSSFSLFSVMHYSNEVQRMSHREHDKIWLILFTLIAFYIYGLMLVILKTPSWHTTYPIQLSWLLN